MRRADNAWLSLNYTSPNAALNIIWENDSGGYYQGWVREDGSVLASWNGPKANLFSDVPGSIATNDYLNGVYNPTSWIIATAQPVPEPSTVVLLGIGAASMLVYVFRRHSKAS